MNPVWMVVGGVAVLLYFARQAGVIGGGSESAGTDLSAGAGANATTAARPRPVGATNALLPTGAAMSLLPNALTTLQGAAGAAASVSPVAANPGTAPSAFNPNVAGPISAPSVNVQIPSYIDASYVPTINTTLGQPTQPGDAGVTGIPIAIAPDIPMAVADDYVAPQYSDAPAQQQQQDYEPLQI